MNSGATSRVRFCPIDINPMIFPATNSVTFKKAKASDALEIVVFRLDQGYWSTFFKRFSPNSKTESKLTAEFEDISILLFRGIPSG